MRTVLNHPAYELIKGCGLQHFKEKEYAWLSGQNWLSLLQAHKPGDYTFFDLELKTGFLKSRFNDNTEMIDILSSWKVKVTLALFVAMVIYFTIDAFKAGYEEGKLNLTFYAG